MKEIQINLINLFKNIKTSKSIFDIYIEENKEDNNNKKSNKFLDILKKQKSYKIKICKKK